MAVASITEKLNTTENSLKGSVHYNITQWHY